ncbi:MAG: DUF2887 domain-containing protein [cyanobacterium endosymbiont of Rhopalodia sterrenbergii]
MEFFFLRMLNKTLPTYFCKVLFKTNNLFYKRLVLYLFFYLSQTNINNDWNKNVIYPNLHRM